MEPYWMCDYCGFEAENDDEKERHFSVSMEDTQHWQTQVREERGQKDFQWS